MTTSERWTKRIERACADPDLASSNRRITRVHYDLSDALADALGREGGPNFHSWAVWGSKKAGVTIRQEDLGDAIRNLTVTAALVGGLVGVAVGLLLGHGWLGFYVAGFIGMIVGAATGAHTGRRIAIWSRERAAALCGRATGS